MLGRWAESLFEVSDKMVEREKNGLTKWGPLEPQSIHGLGYDSRNFFRGKIVDDAGVVNQQRLKESGQWLEIFYQTHLDVASGKKYP